MKRLLILLLLLLLLCGSAFAANSWVNDPYCKAVYNFESGTYLTDTQGSTNWNTDVGTTNTDAVFKQGGWCASIGTNDYFRNTDAQLAAGFPLKSDSTNTVYSVCFWFRAGAVSGVDYLMAKGWGNDVTATFGLYESAGVFQGWTGHTGGTPQFFSAASGAFVNAQWYHISVTVNMTSKAWHWRIWDDTAGALFEDKTGTFANTPIITETDSLNLGNTKYGSANASGQYDELVFFSDILTSVEMDEISAGTYVGTATGDTSHGAMF